MIKLGKVSEETKASKGQPVTEPLAPNGFSA